MEWRRHLVKQFFSSIFELHSFSLVIHCLVGGFNPFEKYQSKWIISPGRIENKIIWNHHPVVLSKAGTWVIFNKYIQKQSSVQWNPRKRWGKKTSTYHCRNLFGWMKFWRFCRGGHSDQTKQTVPKTRWTVEYTGDTADDSHPKKHWIDENWRPDFPITKGLKKA